MRKLKIVLVGGGSFRWTPRLVCNILENASLNGSYVVLYDINSQMLELTGKLSEKYRALYKSDTTFAHTTDQAEALEGADAVVVTLSTGGLEAMQQDLKIPETFGIFHTVIEAIVRPQALREALTVEAALEGSFEKALSVMMTDPLLPSVEIARPMLEALIAATYKWLPQF